MAKLKSRIITDFSGGEVRNVSDFEMADNQLKLCRNWDIDERGRLRKRKGYQNWGNDVSKQFIGTHLFTRITLGSTPTTYHVAVTEGANGELWKINGNYTTQKYTPERVSIPRLPIEVIWLTGVKAG